MEPRRAQVAAGREMNTHIFHRGDGYFYNVRERRGNRIRLKCREYHRGCRGTAVLFLHSNELHHRALHDHDQDHLLLEDMNMRRNMIQCVAESTGRLKPRKILIQHKLDCRNRKSLHGDGTFKKRPKKPKCAQIYNIVTKYGNSVIAILRAIMMSRTEQAYVALFSFIKSIAPNLKPCRFHCDFERAEVNAIRSVFSRQCIIIGCLWHYAVACCRYARSLGLGVLINRNYLVSKFVRCLCAAPLLPKLLIVEGVNELWREVEASCWARELQPLFDYFDAEWAPRIEELCVYGIPERTNNCSESDNRVLANVIQGNYPNVWEMIDGFVKLEFLAWSDKLAVDAGRSPTGMQRWSVLTNDSRIRNFSQQLTQGHITPGEFLRRASWAVLAAVRHGIEEDDGDIDDSSDSDESLTATDSDPE